MAWTTRRPRSFPIPAAVLAACTALGAAAAQESVTHGAGPGAGATHPWPGYRGPAQDGHAPAGARLPLAWGEDQGVLWKVPVPGLGWSSPVVDRGGRVWLTTAVADGEAARGNRVGSMRSGPVDLLLIGFDAATGEEVVRTRCFHVEDPGAKHPNNSYASPTPTLAGDLVVAHFGTFGTAAVDGGSGEIVWRRDDIHCDHILAPGSSPVVVDDLVVFHMDGGDEQFVVALDAASGKTRWNTPRTVDYGDLPGDSRKAYGTPLRLHGFGEAGTVLVSSGAEAVYGYAARTGEELWRHEIRGFSMAARPVLLARDAGSAVVALSSGFNRPTLHALRLDAGGAAPERVWNARRGAPNIPTPVCAHGMLFVVNDASVASCLDAETGKTLWLHRLYGEHYASPVFVPDPSGGETSGGQAPDKEATGGAVVFFDRGGRAVVVAAEPEYRELGVNELGSGEADGGFFASPAVLGDTWIFRTRNALYRVGGAE